MTARTLCYSLVVPGERGKLSTLADYLIDRCPLDVASSGINTANATAHVRFRTGSDSQAEKVAMRIAGDRPFSIVTGYGAHARTVFEHCPS